MERHEEVIAQLESESDVWAENVNLLASIKHIAHISRLAQTVPLAAREKMIGRQEAMLDALMRQAFIEGAFRAVDVINESKKLDTKNADHIGLSRRRQA